MFKRAMALAAILSLAVAAPIAARAPLSIDESTTAIACEGVSNAAGTIRLTVAVPSGSGPAGFLLAWAAPADPDIDPPTLVSQELSATIVDDAVIATYGMYTPGDLGLVDGEPVFVGWAELAATLTPSGPVETLDQETRNGNRQFRIEGTSQPLAVAGSVTVPTLGSFDLGGCAGEHETLSIFGTQPNATVATIDRTRVECFWATDEGAVGFTAQADEAGTFIDLVVFDAAGVHFGAGVPALTPGGIEADLALDTGGSATLGATFESYEHTRWMDRGAGGWVMVSLDLLSVAGSLSVQTSAGTTVLSMDDVACLADTRHVLSQSTTPGA